MQLMPCMTLELSKSTEKQQGVTFYVCPCTKAQISDAIITSPLPRQVPESPCSNPRPRQGQAESSRRRAEVTGSQSENPSCRPRLQKPPVTVLSSSPHWPAVSSPEHPTTASHSRSLASHSLACHWPLLNRHLDARTRFDAFVGGPRNHNAGLHEIFKAGLASGGWHWVVAAMGCGGCAIPIRVPLLLQASRAYGHIAVDHADSIPAFLSLTG